VDRQVPRVGVAAGVGVHRVGEAPGLADLLEQAAGHPAAEDLVGHREGPAILVVDREAPPAEAEVRLLGVVVLDDDRWLERGGWAVGAGRPPPLVPPKAATTPSPTAA